MSCIRWTTRLILYALLVAACGRLPVTVAPVAPDTTILPPIPASVPSQLGPIPVMWAERLADWKGQELMGGFHAGERVIYISRRVTNLVVQWHTLFHERCHVLLFDSGLRNVITQDIEQQVCDVFATMQVADMILARRAK